MFSETMSPKGHYETRPNESSYGKFAHFKANNNYKSNQQLDDLQDRFSFTSGDNTSVGTLRQTSPPTAEELVQIEQILTVE